MEVPEDKPILNKEFWNNRYLTNEIGWDIGYCSTPLKEYIDQLDDKSMRILIPGCGNGYEAEYLYNHGFKNTFVVDLSETALDQLKERVPQYPDNQLILGDFFELNQSFDLILEQTFFCAIDPQLRSNYAKQAHNLLNINGKLVGLLFDDQLNDNHPPFGGNKEEYQACFSPLFDIVKMERAYNSIAPRTDRELFINLKKK